MYHSPRLGISRVATVVIVIAIIAIAGGAAYFVSTLGSTTSTSSSSSSVTSSSSATSSSISTSAASSSSSSSVMTTSSTSKTSVTAASSSSCPSTSSSATSYSSFTNINVGYPAPGINIGTIAIAQNLGIFAKYGLNVKYTFIASNVAAPGLEGGSLQFYYAAVSTWLLASIGHSNLIAISGGTPRGNPFYLMVDPSITTPQQLVGKTVALNVNPANPASEAFTYIMGTYGLNDSQFQLTYLGNPNLELQALLAGQVSAAVLSPPRSIVAANNGFKQMGPVSTDTAFADPDVVISSGSYLANNQVIETAFLKGMLEAYRDLAVTMNYVSGVTNSTDGVNTTAVLAAESSFTGFNTTLVAQSLKLYQTNNLLGPTMLPDSSTFQAAYYRVLSDNPTLGSVNVTSIENFSVINQLNAPCGFVYHLWGGSPPPAPT